MLRSMSPGPLVRLGSLLVAASLASAGCAGRSSSRGDDGATANASGTATGATGGTSSGSGGTDQSSGGTFGAGDATGTGGSDGGSANAGSGGGAEVGGSTDPGTGGSSVATGGSSNATGGSNGMPNCANVVCPSIPTTCERIVQPPDECCPICPDTGCGECSKPVCEENEHLETIPGDCCPSCVANPPDACEEGQKTYAELRAALIDKYGSTGCKNSSECTLVAESNACAASCPIALPTTTASNFTSNLDNAARDCATCDSPEPSPCPSAIAACVNGKCVATGR